MDLRGIDLNLLVSLDALLAERNVTRAAGRLHLSQPALSTQLARLRQVFDDPLLLPSESGRGMTPTARALALAVPLRSALKDVEAVLRHQPSFYPHTDPRTFRVAASEHAMAVLGQPLLQRLAAETGPGVGVTLRAPEAGRSAAQLEQGEIDLLIDADRRVPRGMKTRLLLRDRLVMVQRKGHPRGTGALDLDGYCALRHVRVTVGGDLDESLAGLGRQRQVACTVEQFLPVPEILRASDWVGALPARQVARHADTLDSFELPFEAPGLTLQLAWHPRNQAEPAVAWLRELIVGVARS